MPICKHCGESIYQTRGGSWVHENGRGICAWAEPADPVRCPKCGGPHPFHDPACVVHPDLIQDHNERERGRMSKSTLQGAQDGCPFCQMVMRRILDGEGIEQIGQSGVYHFEPLNPVTPGHRLFVPAYHYEHAAEAPTATGSVFEWASWWAADRGEDFNLIVNAGAAASQTVPHLHVHYVPRRAGDGLNLPWTAQHEWEGRES